MAVGDTDVTLTVVPISAIRRLAHVVPDFAALAARRGVDTPPAGLYAPTQERLAMHFFLNVFTAWDTK